MRLETVDACQGIFTLIVHVHVAKKMKRQKCSQDTLAALHDCFSALAKEKGVDFLNPDKEYNLSLHS